MSEQNQMAISPVTAGLTGAAIGGIGNYFLGVGAAPKKGYKDAKELLTLEQDKFEKLKKEIDASDNADAKAEFQKLEKGRVTVSNAGDTLVSNQANIKYKLDETVSKAGIKIDVNTEKTALDNARNKVDEIVKNAETTKDGKKISELKAAAKKEVDDKVSTALTEPEEKWSAERKELETTIKNESDAAKKTKLEKQRNALVKKEVRAKLLGDPESAYSIYHTAAKNAIDANRSAYRTAANNVADAKGKYTNAIIEKVGADDTYKKATANETGSLVEQLKYKIGKLSEKADDLRKAEIDKLVGENGSLKDLDTGKFKKFLPKAKMWPTVIAAAALGLAGVALAYMVGPKNATPADVA